MKSRLDEDRIAITLAHPALSFANNTKVRHILDLNKSVISINSYRDITICTVLMLICSPFYHMNLNSI